MVTVAYYRHDKSGNRMRGKQRGGGFWGGAQLHSPISDISDQSNVSNRVLTIT